MPDDSIRFGPELTCGRWLSYSRSTRFLLLELARLCRPHEGWCRLPPASVASPHPIGRTVDLLGGRRREVSGALMALTSDAEPGGLPTVVYQRAEDDGYVAPTEAAEGPLLLVIPGWLQLFGPTGSALRMRRLRARQKAAEGEADGVTCDDGEDEGERHSDESEGED